LTCEKFCPFAFQALSTEIARPYYFLFSNFIKPEVTANSKGPSGSRIRSDLDQTAHKICKTILHQNWLEFRVTDNSITDRIDTKIDADLYRSGSGTVFAQKSKLIQKSANAKELAHSLEIALKNT